MTVEASLIFPAWIPPLGGEGTIYVSKGSTVSCELCLISGVSKSRSRLLLFLLKNRKTDRAAMASGTVTPTTIPDIAPPPSLDFPVVVPDPGSSPFVVDPPGDSDADPSPPTPFLSTKELSAIRKDLSVKVGSLTGKM